jgi:hypothetical protein
VLHVAVLPRATVVPNVSRPYRTGARSLLAQKTSWRHSPSLLQKWAWYPAPFARIGKNVAVPADHPARIGRPRAVEIDAVPRGHVLYREGLLQILDLTQIPPVFAVV